MKAKRDEIVYEAIYDSLEPHLNKLGEITTQFAHQVTGFPYSDVQRTFRHVMDIMVEQKKARKIRNGVYRIYKPNKKYAIA